MKIVVFGYGNTLCSDDGLGFLAAGLLSEQINDPAVEVIASQQLGPEMAEHLRLADLAIFIDSNCFGAPGEISCCLLSADTCQQGSISHHFQPGALLAICQAFYGHTPRSFLYSIGAASFELGETLSPLVQAALPALIQRVKGKIQAALLISHTN
jgi:hydrogenase maturation protease